MLVDTHSHLNFNAYKDDADEVIRRSLYGGVWMINVGSQFSTSKRAVEMAEKYQQGVYAAIGLHPIHLAEGIFKTKVDTEEISFQTKDENFDYEAYKGLAQSKKVAAIGECGLDYYYKPKTKIKLEQFKEKQKQVFLKHLELAQELNLPIIIHCRSAHEDLLQILSDNSSVDNSLTGVIHCFTGTMEDAQEYTEMGFYIGLNGIIFKFNIDKIIKKLPVDKILVETDCPYLTPAPMEGRNEPLYVKYVAEKVAGLKNLRYEEVCEISTKNAKDLFKI